MPNDLLDFEEPVGGLLKEIEALRLMPQTPERAASIARLEARIRELRAEIFAGLGPWERLLVARHANRPCTLDYVERLFSDFTELHGDRRFADDHAVVGGFATFEDQTVMVIGHQKGRDSKQRVYRNFGMANPEGYRKALRLMELAARFHRPIITMIDTQGAYPGVGAEERGQSEAIARNLLVMSRLPVPTVGVVIGEGGSGGALALGVCDRIYMQENSIYSVISPEGCAAILWGDRSKAVAAADALRLLKPGGVFFVVVPDYLKERTFFWDVDYTHNFVTTERRMKQLFNDGGFIVERVVRSIGAATGLRRDVLAAAALLTNRPGLNTLARRTGTEDLLFKVRKNLFETLTFVARKPT